MMVKHTSYREMIAYLLMYIIGALPFILMLPFLFINSPDFLAAFSRYFCNTCVPMMFFWWSVGVLTLIAVRSKLFGLIFGIGAVLLISCTNIPSYLQLSELGLITLFNISVLQPLLPTLSAVLAIIVFFSTQNKKLAFFGSFFTVALIHFLMNLTGNIAADLSLLIPYGFGILPYFLEHPLKKLLRGKTIVSDKTADSITEQI